jgi:hypothetical protein
MYSKTAGEEFERGQPGASQQTGLALVRRRLPIATVCLSCGASSLPGPASAGWKIACRREEAGVRKLCFSKSEAAS